jgi:hypothetical protein
MALTRFSHQRPRFASLALRFCVVRLTSMDDWLRLLVLLALPVVAALLQRRGPAEDASTDHDPDGACR